MENNENKVEETQEIKEEITVESLQAKLQESEQKYLRSLADIENNRRRFEKLQSDMSKYAVAEFAKDMISILDIFNKAFIGVNESEIQDNSFKNFAFGIRLTQKEMEKSLSKFGVVKIDCLDKKFDANFHESLYAKEDATKENNTVAEIIEEGYMIHDRLLRPAKVGIIKNNH